VGRRAPRPAPARGRGRLSPAWSPLAEGRRQRRALDGLQRAELFEDDAQVVELSARKVYGQILDRENKGQEGPFARVRLSVVAAL
jgi:hypothetical protein